MKRNRAEYNRISYVRREIRTGRTGPLCFLLGETKLELDLAVCLVGNIKVQFFFHCSVSQFWSQFTAERSKQNQRQKGSSFILLINN